MESILPVSQPILLTGLAGPSLAWFSELGLGYYPVQAGPRAVYDVAYWERFRAQADTPIGRALMRARVEMVERHTQDTACDVGIGSGAFIDARRASRRSTYGYDINPHAVAWLEERNLFADPHLVKFPVITLWDVLEHIADFRSLIAQVQQFVFVSLPIFTGPEDVLRSKHFRKDEHVWYFTIGGLKKLFDCLGFDCVEINEIETELGRESIGSFAFKRRAA